MSRIPDELRETIARNIRECRMAKYPGRGGGKLCAEAFGVSHQQWSPWERGKRTPDELRLRQIAEFFGVTVAYMRQDNRIRQNRQASEQPSESSPGMSGGGFFTFMNPHAASLPDGSLSNGPGARKGTVYVPVFVLLPYLPDDMKALYDQFNAVMNGRQAPGHPSV